MTWVWILLGILGLLALLLAARVKIRFSFGMEDGFSGEARYLFFRYRFPTEEKPESEAEKKKKEEKKTGKPDKKQSIRDIIKEKGFAGFLKFLSELASIAAGAAKRLLLHFVLKEMKIHVTIGAEDAATTAVLYGTIGGVIYPAASTLVTAFRCRHYDVRITPNFNGEELSAQMFLDGSVRLVFLITVGLYALLRYVKMILRQKREEGRQAAMTGEAVGKS
ncbi:DUF2953 domain-containing protein [Faecalispora anaeroviscerum]|uniref:DUF2953 domain-containing protein n=1 Tax=Faecalispora anaeroviscerum TaxID=2991836 RepID=UPI0024BA6E7B|nr:DUF2953 domain-containing protein [Faecalispora anaeroviscerum]